jgi:hypothetical protein
MSKVIAHSLVLSLLVLGCGRLEEQPIGETMGEAGSGGASMQASGGTTVAGSPGSAGTPMSSGGKASANPEGEPCAGDVCDPGSGCFVQSGATIDEGVCTPLCSPDNQFDQTPWGMPCSFAVGGGDGICRPFLRQVQLDGPAAAMGSVASSVGVCTKSCDPLEQNCPEGFSCDLTDTPQGALASWSYACMPVLSPLATGAGCTGTSSGQCDVGATCNVTSNGTCAEFCDTEASNPCPAMQECVKPDWFPADSPAGVCVVP